jgi:hypothetical protein
MQNMCHSLFPIAALKKHPKDVAIFPSTIASTYGTHLPQNYVQVLRQSCLVRLEPSFEIISVPEHECCHSLFNAVVTTHCDCDNKTNQTRGEEG